MVGFWRKIEAVDRGENAGPGQPLPSATSSYTWTEELAPSLDLSDNGSSVVPVEPQYLSCIWEPIDSFKEARRSGSGASNSEYTSIFQGF